MSIRLIISDLHLDDTEPVRTQALVDLIGHFGDNLAELYILGDLFNYWVGDDYQPDCARIVAEQVKPLPWVGWIFGNRDFLLGTGGYFALSGMHPLPEVYRLQLAGRNSILCHGDHLCIADVQHQQNRSRYVTETFQQQLLSKSVADRLAIANESSDISRDRKKILNDYIMDVDSNAVESLLTANQAALLVHGHTHRPALHQHKNGMRMVLGEWKARGWYIIEQGHVLSLVSFPIPFDPDDFQVLATINEY